MIPEPRYRSVPPRRAARVRQTLARLGTLAEDVARVGIERWTDGMSQVLDESAKELAQLGLSGARQVVVDVASLLAVLRPTGQPAKAQPAPSWKGLLARSAARRAAGALGGQATARVEPVVVSAQAAPALLARALLKLSLIAPAARAYPHGPRARLEPLLRGALESDERPVLKGRVLVPLVQGLAWDAGLGLVDVKPPLPAEACALVGRLVCDHQVKPAGVTAGTVRRVKPGVAVSGRVDRRMLRGAEPALAEVLRAVLRELADPFLVAPAPRLVGPLTQLRADHVLRVDVLADAAGDSCTVPGPLVPPADGKPAGSTWWLLATPRARGGMLELAPVLGWYAARGRWVERVRLDAGTPAPVDPEPVLDACAEALADLQVSGLARGLASRGAVRELAAELDASGWRVLGERMRALTDAEPERGARALYGAMHLVDRLRTGPRALPEREGAR